MHFSKKENYYYLFNNISSTISAIANDEVKPGLSIPTKLTNPSKSWSISSFIIKSLKGSPGPCNFGLNLK